MLASSRSARADDMPWPTGLDGPFALKLDFYGQAEIGAFVALDDFSHFGGLGVKSTMSLAGIGIALGARWEHDPAGGALGFTEGQLRPFSLAEWRLYRIVDPYLALGGELGDSTGGFRAAIYGAAGVDVALWPSEVHPALSLEYQRRLKQTPNDFSDQALWLGLSLRTIL